MQKELLQLYRRDLIRLKEEILAYQEEENIWKVEKQISNSAANLSLHLCGNLQHFIGHILGDTKYVRNRDLEFSKTAVSRSEIVNEIEQTLTTLEKVIPNIDSSQFEEEFPVQVFKEPYSNIQMIVHLFGHLNYHLGQVNYHRRLIES
jgi:hypothetical protein